MQHEKKDAGFEEYEAIVILNCKDKDAKIMMDIYFEEKEPVENIKLVVPAKRVKCFRMDYPDKIGGTKIDRLYQYALS